MDFDKGMFLTDYNTILIIWKDSGEPRASNAYRPNFRKLPFLPIYSLTLLLNDSYHVADSFIDVYSYDEDDMVLDPYLAEHLAHFGIDIMSMKKTEKTMVELEIDANNKVSSFTFWLVLCG